MLPGGCLDSRSLAPRVSVACLALPRAFHTDGQAAREGSVQCRNGDRRWWRAGEALISPRHHRALSQAQRRHQSSGMGKAWERVLQRKMLASVLV
jgi:hypothetical protein